VKSGAADDDVWKLRAPPTTPPPPPPTEAKARGVTAQGPPETAIASATRGALLIAGGRGSPARVAAWTTGVGEPFAARSSAAEGEEIIGPILVIEEDSCCAGDPVPR